MSGFRTMSGAIKAHKNAGGHFFDGDTMEFFSSRILHDTYEPKTGMFVTSDVFGEEPEDPRTYAVRRINLDNPKRIDNVGERQATLKAAKALLRAELDLA